jgi:hypothetical protein
MDQVKTLIKPLNDNNPAIRSQAAAKLGACANLRAVDPLISMLGCDYAKVQIEVAKALGKVGDTKAIDALSHVIKYSESTKTAVARHFIVRNGVPYDDPIYELGSRNTSFTVFSNHPSCLCN